MCRQSPDQLSDYWPEEPDYSDEYMYHTARRDHTRVFHQKKQYPQNILYKVDCELDRAITNLVDFILIHFLHHTVQLIVFIIMIIFVLHFLLFCSLIQFHFQRYLCASIMLLHDISVIYFINFFIQLSV